MNEVFGLPVEHLSATFAAKYPITWMTLVGFRYTDGTLPVDVIPALLCRQEYQQQIKLWVLETMQAHWRRLAGSGTIQTVYDLKSRK